MHGKGDTLQLAEILDELKAKVDAQLERYLPTAEDAPEVIREPMAYSLLAGGKRIRPILVLLSCRACGGSDDDALPAACGVEMIHTYSLIHDDLPAMDDDALRRGRPTNHVVFGDGMAILAGDALLTEAFTLIAASTPRRERVAAIVEVLGRAAGPIGMVGGQALDLTSDGMQVSAERLAEIHRLKTAALFAASARIGAEAAGASADTARILEEYGLQLGLAFQAIDDVLDVVSSADVLGKTAGKDEKQDKLTSIVVHGVDGAREQAQRYSKAARHAAEQLPDGALLIDVVDRLMDRIS